MTGTVSHLVGVSSIKDTKISKVNLYTGLAEVTRVLKVDLKAGDNQVVISGLPNVLVEESLRIEGNGQCTIHEVSISEIPRPSADTALKSSKLTSLLGEQGALEKALVRCKNCILSIEKFQESLNVQHLAADQLKTVHQEVEDVSAELDNNLLDLEGSLAENVNQIRKEREILGEVREDDKLRKRVTIKIVAENDCEVEFLVVYVVSEATWDATYDIYVNMDTKEKPISLIYKGAIMQNTGETWKDVSLALETVTPTFGLAVPQLTPWTLSVSRPCLYLRKSQKRPSFASIGGLAEQRRVALSNADELDTLAETEDDSESASDVEPTPMRNRTMRITSKGNINATFAVPGLISIPSDGTSHNVTICKVSLGAVMSWVAVPKRNAKAYLTAKVKNDSEYTLLKGIASVYVDGSFISRSDVPPVSPQETFDCPLGIDPSIRITYHPRSKKVKRSGLAYKSCTYTLEQRITIVNNKPTHPLSSIKIYDQIPVSEDASIVVNLINPPLLLSSKKKGIPPTAESVAVRASVTEQGCRIRAQWDGMDDDGVGEGLDPVLVGKDGKLHWICEELPSQSKVILVLAWQVVCPHGTDIMGMDI